MDSRARPCPNIRVMKGKVKEIEYDPIKIRAEQIEQEGVQTREIERGQGQGRDRGGQGFSM